MTRVRWIMLMVWAIAAMAFAIGLGMVAIGNAQQAAPVLGTNADVNVPNGSASVAIAASTPSSAGEVPDVICREVCETTGTNSMRCGDSNVSATRGSLIAKSTCKTFCVPGAISCYGNGASVTAGITETKRK